MVHRDPLAVAQAERRRRQAAQPAVQPVGAWQRARRGRGVAVLDLRALDADERERDPLAAAASATAWLCTGTLRTWTSAPAWLDRQPVARLDRPRPERAGDDGADAAKRERAIDREPHRPGGGPAARRAGDAVEGRPAARPGRPRCATRPRPSARRRRALPRAAPRREPRQLGELVVDQISLGQRDHAGGDVQELDDARCSRVCGITPSSAATTSRNMSMPVAPADHLRRTARDRARRRSSRRPDGSRAGVAELDRDAARLLLGSRSVSTPVSAATSAVLP